MKYRTLGLVVALLAVSTLACSLFGGGETPPPIQPPTPEVPPTSAPTEPPPTSAPTQPPTPESPAGGGTATVVLVNNTDADVCYVYISPVESDDWGEDWLGAEEVVGSRESREFTVPAGNYDMRADDCGHYTLDQRMGVAVSGRTEWVIGGMPESVLLQDDFSDPNSGWEVGNYDTGSVGYAQGTYSVVSYGDSNMMWGLAYRNFTDVIIEVDATQVSAPSNNNNAYGVMCRVQEDDDGYVLRISGDGYYAIHRTVDGHFEPLVDWTTSSVIRQGNATNHIRVVCDGSYLALFANGELLAEAQDTTYAEGDIALTATSFESTSTEVHFDNLVVTATTP